MFFDWDERKAAANWQKHRIFFSEATEVFGDDLSSCVTDPDNSYGEARYLIFGKSLSGKALAVSFTDESDVIRIISARRMTAAERKAYEQ
jgi:uncharacterized DUF497 family protein